MAVSKAQKAIKLSELKDRMSKAKSLMFAQYIGLKVNEIGELRQKLRDADAEMKVGKKTLMRIAAKECGLPEVADGNMEGPIACIFSFVDPLSGAQVAFKFGKDHNQVKLLGGIYDGKSLTREAAVEMAKMPGRMELLAIFATMLRSPLVSFAGMCNAPLSGFARGLAELAKKKTESPQS